MTVVASGVPAERLKLLRAAFMAMANDPEYRADVARFDSTRTAPLAGAEVEKLMKALAAGATPAVIDAYNRLKQQ
jgi:hypothetical protein